MKYPLTVGQPCWPTSDNRAWQSTWARRGGNPLPPAYRSKCCVSPCPKRAKRIDRRHLHFTYSHCGKDHVFFNGFGKHWKNRKTNFVEIRLSNVVHKLEHEAKNIRFLGECCYLLHCGRWRHERKSIAIQLEVPFMSTKYYAIRGFQPDIDFQDAIVHWMSNYQIRRPLKLSARAHLDKVPEAQLQHPSHLARSWVWVLVSLMGRFRCWSRWKVPW